MAAAPPGLDDGWAPGRPDRYAVSITLRGSLVDVDDEVLATFADRVQSRDVGRAAGADGIVELSFTHVSTDLWLTLLATMNATRATGCEAVAISAEVVGPRPRALGRR